MQLKILFVFALLFGNIFLLNVNGDTQVWENEYGKLEVWPMTAQGFGRFTQYANLTWYYPDNTVDIAFRFDKPLNYGKIWYKNHLGNWIPVSMDSVKYNKKQYYVYSDFNIQQDKLYQLKWTYEPKDRDGKWDLFMKLSSDTWQQAFASDRFVHLDPWWDSDWGTYVPITINSGMIETSLKNFPILVNCTDQDIINNCQSNGEDIRFLNVDNTTEYFYEIENWSPGGFDVWVNITDIGSGADTTFLMYYNNLAASDNQSKTDVWNSDYSVVLHMNQSSGFMNDSTVDGVNFKQGGNPGGYEATGMVGYGMNGDGNDDYFLNTSLDITGWSDATVELWYNPDINHEVDRVEYLWSSKHSPGPEDARIVFKHGATGVGDSGFSTVWDDGTEEGGSDYNYNYATCFCYYVSVIDANSFVYGYKNTSRTISDAAVNFDMAGMDNEHNIGRRVSGTKYYDGILDEVRISSVPRNWSWINATFYTINNNSEFLTWGNPYSTLYPPDYFNASTQSITKMWLNWTVNTTQTHTVIERNSIQNWNRGEGTEIYNGTGVNHSDNGITSYTTHYYRAWGYNSSQNNYSAYSILSSNITGPDNPSGLSSEYSPESYLNITWSFASNGDTVMVRQRANDYPTGPTNGSLCYNGTLSYYNHSNPNATDHFTLWSYNSSVNLFSSGINAEFGGFTINVYNEINGSNITDWNITISNSDGTETYYNDNCDNTHIINVEDCPLGDDILIIISEGNFSSRTYYMDLESGNQYSLTAFLVPLGEFNNYSLYVKNEIETRVENAFVEISYHNTTDDVFKLVSSFYTDANGEASVSLIPGEVYKVNITKSGYEDNFGNNWIPDPDYYGVYYPKGFILYFIRPDENITTFSDCIHFNATINSGGTVQVWYEDICTSTTNTTIYIYEYYNGSLSLNDTDTRTGDDSFTFTDNNYNTSRHHWVMLYVNHSRFGFERVIYELYPIRTKASISTLEDRFVQVFGELEFGWVNFFLVFIPCLFFLVVFGAAHAGLGVMSSGLWLGFANFLIDFDATRLILFGTISGMMVLFGVGIIIVKRGRNVL